ncbi:MAG: glycosyltransferase [Candidatus Moraniibacteriota bacterium]|nr:MAG: glycosyltransferase [Candidatus Moranbacteria bacterium]
MKLIVNIPAYNEAEKIGETIRRIPRTLKGIDEIVVHVVDDGSTDHTSEIAQEAGANRVIVHQRNRGLGKAFRTSVEAALEANADVMVNIDADGQFDPNDIGTILAPVLAGTADIVSADRFGEHAAKNIPLIKDRLNRLAARLISGFLKTPIQDLTCGFRTYSRESLLRLNLLENFTYTQEVIIDAIGKGLKIVWIPVSVTYFAERKSKMTKSIVNYIRQSSRIIVKAVRDVRPMKFFGIPGFILIGIAVLLFFIFFGFYVQDFKISPYRNYLFFSALFFIIGLQFVVFALLADMVKSNRRLIEEQLYLTKKNLSAKREETEK